MNDLKDVWEQVSEALEAHGIEFRVGMGGEGDLADCTVMCLAGDMKSTVAEMGRTPRDHVVMVRIDEDTKRHLDDWIATGAVKSRSARESSHNFERPSTTSAGRDTGSRKWRDRS